MQDFLLANPNNYMIAAVHLVFDGSTAADWVIGKLEGFVVQTNTTVCVCVCACVRAWMGGAHNTMCEAHTHPAALGAYTKV